MGKKLDVTPNDVLKFTKSSATPVKLLLQSKSNEPITFKIQTTSPLKFCVRPRFGVLKSGESVTVDIILKKEEKLKDGAAKDKFLVRALKLPAHIDPGGSMINFWKEIPSKCASVEEHQVICEYDDICTQKSSHEKSKLNFEKDTSLANTEKGANTNTEKGVSKQRSKTGLGKGVTKSISFIKITDYEILNVIEQGPDNMSKSQKPVGKHKSRDGSSGNRSGHASKSKSGHSTGQSSANINQDQSVEQYLRRTQIIQYITLVLVLLLAAGFAYILRHQLQFDPKAQIEEALKAEENMYKCKNQKC